MTVIGVDDTDSRERGMCTTYLAAELAERLREGGRTDEDASSDDSDGGAGSDNPDEGASVERLLLVRLNPAVEHKTRGNAALAVHTDADPETAFEIAREEVARVAETDDPRTNPGLVVAPGAPGDAPEAVAEFARSAVRDRLAIEDAEAVIEDAGYRSDGWKLGRGRIGALAAVGAWRAFGGQAAVGGGDSVGIAADWTYECISYRERERVGTPREVDAESVFDAADAAYPAAWDTVDRETGELVCVPHTPGPILHGIRGDDHATVREVAEAIESEPVSRRALFVTNQGTDAHLRDAGGLEAVEDGRAYRVEGTVAEAPETRRGGHVFFALEDSESGAKLRCAAFEPTKRFRDRVRDLRPGDRIAACGEVSDGTLKLEKFAVRELDRTELVTPDCPDCGRSMESAGAGQGYRCRDCKTAADGKVEREVERELEVGWYEVPPEARRHIAKPLVRGGFDAPIHPEK
ncbi:tRNA(Ile)(2)-agmatinylcytidine synthase [Halorussus gelatinilyticus]|uniref:tRNA(Ile2) 2-agmatinylcytidine synthetase TiaS n=1 Tax=Halorussus gelatinilyticus TaxID=2937524 RepID=A0A8U0IL60_9EURY|nr:tRNA(Ile)(2)-agmatinylcytidine synthase [Halorussus gelatinilyticus]UPW01863.1 tRNA(Ile)(2)-agmatinylcytidine synthase [Halorussus gelatinilyticus]